MVGIKVEPLSQLAAKMSVREANLLRTHAGTIPPCLYDCLMLAAVTTNRVLSIRSLMLSCPLQEISLVNCKEFTPEHASMIAHCLQEGCNKLQVINLSGCNTGIQGTKLFLRLATGRILPNARTYGVNSSQHIPKTDRIALTSSAVLHLQADFYIDIENYQLFLDALGNQTILNLNVSCLHAVELGFTRIQKLLKKMTDKLTQVQLVKGCNFEMNNLHSMDEHTSSFIHKLSASTLTTESPNDVPSLYYFDAFNCFSNLGYLNLSGNCIGTYAIFTILKNLSEKARLTHLILNSCNIGPKNHYIDKISELRCIEKLQHLELANNRLGFIVDLMKLLTKCSSTLVYLNLKMNFLSRANIPNINKLLRPPYRLYKLDLCENNFPVNDKFEVILLNVSCHSVIC